MIEIEGDRSLTNQDVAGLLAQIRKDPRTTNPRVLSINMLAQMKAKNGGYPLDMYHPILDAVRVNNEDEELKITEAGFTREYVAKAFPKFMYRRNLHPKFAKSAQEMERIALMTAEAQKIERATINEGDFIETRVIKDAAEEKKLLAEPATKIVTKWVSRITNVEPMKQGPEEDPEVTIARLRGEISGLEKNRKGQAA